jgi:hypothetical protein
VLSLMHVIVLGLIAEAFESLNPKFNVLGNSVWIAP